MVEELVPAGNSSPKGMKLDKKQMALDILTDVLELSQLDAAQAVRSIDVVIEAGIKRVSFWRKAGRYFFSIILCRDTPPLLLPESAEKE